jgi:hypothetical protein
VLGQATGTWTHKTHHGPDSGEATTFPHIVFSPARSGGYIQMAQILWTPEMESRNCPSRTPETLNGHNSRLQSPIATRSEPKLYSSSRSFQRHSHIQIWGQEEVDSRLLVVGTQTANLTPGPSFAHNGGYRCPNDQCEAIFDIYVSRPFQWHQENTNARCFGPCCRVLNIWESRRTPNPQLFQVLGFTPTLGQSGVAMYENFWGWEMKRPLIPFGDVKSIPSSAYNYYH